MAIIIFLIVLSLLIVVHELGHFLVAKRFGIRVDEFGLGYPPRAKKLFSWKGTDFTLNWLPFGGFVKIFGENKNEQVPLICQSSDSFSVKHRGIQASVLVAGVVGNLLFAWLLFVVGFNIGLPAPKSLGFPLTDSNTVVVSILPNSPADLAGLKQGDKIIRIGEGTPPNPSPEDVAVYLSQNERALITYVRGRTESSVEVIPVLGIKEDGQAIGIVMDEMGIARLPFLQSVWQGLVITAKLTSLTAVALAQFFSEAIFGRADLSAVAGPIGIVALVGDASALGFVYILTFTALISINLALINLLPFPALDGGRLLFVIIESITKREIPARVANALNSIGFALLILLMILISIQDIRNLF